MQNSQNSAKFKNNSMKALAIVGLLAVLVLGFWGVIRVAILVPGIGNALAAVGASISSIFVPAERLEITLPSANVPSGEPLSITWNHVGKRGEGSYTLSYACRSGFSMESITPTGVYQKAPCETPFNYTNSQTEIRVIPQSQSARFLDVPVTLSYTRSGDENPSATTDTAITVENSAVSVTPTPSGATPPPSPRPTPSPVTPGSRTDQTYRFVGSGTASDPSGTPDLEVSITSIGTLDRATNVFTPSATVVAGQRAAVQFSVTNRGTKTAEFWSFNAALPTTPFHIFHSDTQRSLGPGDRIEYTIGFDEIDSRTTSTFTVNVDPTGGIRELREDNNIAKITFRVIIP